MPDWRHIQGRIRKARTSKDPAAELAVLYQTTNDAMVAFELAQFHEKAGSHADAAQWYQAAAQRFRRAQWKLKAEQALARLGVEVPLAAVEAEAEAPMHRMSDARGVISAESEAPNEFTEAAAAPDTGEIAEVDDSGAGMPASNESAATADAAAGDLAKKKRRRGRRGGRGRRKKGDAAPAAARTSAAKSEVSGVVASIPSGRQPLRRTPAPSAPPPEPRRRAAEPEEESQPHIVGGVGPAAWQSRRHTGGEPALASRLAQLESKLRRLLSALPESLENSDQAPAGPGVFVVSDSDLHEVYYVEACQTLRIGVGNIVKTGRTREGVNIRGRLAEHLGITEAQVSKYLKQHCAVRWIQLDDEAQMVAHFAVAVLKPSAND